MNGDVSEERAARPDVCLLVEGTYPFVAGGVSSWVHDIILGHPSLRFAILNIGSHPDCYGEPRYKLPENVVGLHKVFCQGDDGKGAPLEGSARAELAEQIRRARTRADTAARPSRVLSAFRRLHVDGEASLGLIDDLGANDLEIADLLHGRASFTLLADLAAELAPAAPFLDLFWHFRAIHVPLLRLLATPPVAASCYHAVSTGYAGLLAAMWSRRLGQPLIITEHGIYAREREMELARAEWINDRRPGAGEEGSWTWAPQISPLRRMWSRFFRTLSRIAYLQATRIVTLSEVNRRRQLDDGAPAEKIEIIPNGVALKAGSAGEHGGGSADGDADGDVEEEGGLAVTPLRPAPLRVGFVGRVVPIKDVISFIKACDLALRAVDMEVSIIGPAEEDASYARRCRQLVERLERGQQIRFTGPKPPSEIYSDLDFVVLTSFSEGQPLVILEAYAAGVPVIASDVGACREMIEGRTPPDRALGPSGIVCPVASPKATAAALVRLARDSSLRQRMGLAGRKRVTSFYQRRAMLDAYRRLYETLVMPSRE